MRTEPGQAQLDMRVAATSVAERVRWVDERRRLGMTLAWQQLDVARITDPVKQADFLLRRLYPEMPEAWFRDVVAKLDAMHAAGTWHGFKRPTED